MGVAVMARRARRKTTTAAGPARSGIAPLAAAGPLLSGPLVSGPLLSGLLLSGLLLSGLLLSGLTGCSMQKLAVSSMVPIMDGALVEAYASGDVATVRDALPGQILLLRGVCHTDPDRIETWTTLTQLYASYGLIFVEDDDPDRAARLYAEGMTLGLRFLHRRDWFHEAWERGPDALRATIAQRRPAELGPIMTWTAACLGKHVLFNLDDMEALADLPYVYVLTDAAIELVPGYSYGMPFVLKALMLSLTPPMLGGDLEEAHRLFGRAFEVTERRFLLYQLYYARYYCTASLDEACFQATLEEIATAPENLDPDVRLVNRVARQRAERLAAEWEDWF